MSENPFPAINKDNIQPSANPKAITVIRGNSLSEGALGGPVFIRNVSVDPRELRRN
jgi:hypothetical protein